MNGIVNGIRHHRDYSYSGIVVGVKWMLTLEDYLGATSCYGCLGQVDAASCLLCLFLLRSNGLFESS